MKTYSNLFGCSTFCVSDSENNRRNFHGLVDCDEELMEYLKNGEEIELSNVEDRILEVFKDNDVDLSDYTHCIKVGDEYYLTWESLTHGYASL